MELVPEIDSFFEETSYYDELKKVVFSGHFFPVFISGLTGTGKTLLVKQVCANLKRELYRVNITVETDEDQLIGGFRLVNGNTEFFKGPVIQAMELGAILLLDEIDLASPQKIMCLQSILEGDGYYIKRLGEYVKPKKGFNIIATANTKGRGDDDGLYIGTTILNEAFLERFPLTFEKTFPTKSQEKNILTSVAKSLNIIDDDLDEYIDILVKWAYDIRESYTKGAQFDHIISTRRLVQILKAYDIYGQRRKSIEYCINRFDETHKSAFLVAYDVNIEKIEKERNKDKETSIKEENDDFMVSLDGLQAIP